MTGPTMNRLIQAVKLAGWPSFGGALIGGLLVAPLVGLGLALFGAVGSFALAVLVALLVPGRAEVSEEDLFYPGIHLADDRSPLDSVEILDITTVEDSAGGKKRWLLPNGEQRLEPAGPINTGENDGHQ